MAGPAATTWTAPPHKCVPGTKFIVDGFRHTSAAATAYFLTHAHSDHYQGLSDTWQAGPVYCSDITARLVRFKLGVRPELLRVLPLDVPTEVEGGVRVTCVDANHCPGAVQFLFHLPDGRRYIHSGDMRFCDALTAHPALQEARTAGVDALYLDTTYCNPRYVFPAQEASIAYVAAAVAAGVHAGPDAPTTLFLISTYGIGKERILSAVAAAANCFIHVSSDKLGALACLGLPDLDIYTTDAGASPVRVVPWGTLGDTWPFFRPNFAAMEAARAAAGVDRVVGFVPTGWMWEMRKGMAAGEFPVRRKGAAEVHLVPYSEHSNYEELRQYVRWLRPRAVIPTVNVGDGAPGSAKADAAAAAMTKHFRNLVDETSAKRAFFKLGAAAAAAAPKTTAEADAVDDDVAAAAGSADPPEGLTAGGGADVAAADASEEEEDAAAAGCDAAARAGSAAAAAGAVAALAAQAAADTRHHGGATDEDVVVVLDSSDDERDDAGTSAPATDPAIAALRAVLGDAVGSDAQAAALLRAARGDVGAAVNAHFDSLVRGGGGGKPAAAPPPLPTGVNPWTVAKGLKRPRESGSGGAAAGATAAQRSAKKPAFGAAKASAAVVAEEAPSPPPAKRDAAASPAPSPPVAPAAAAGWGQPAPLGTTAKPSEPASPAAAASPAAWGSPVAAETAAAEAAGSQVALPVEQYDPVRHACWAPHTPAPYLHIAATLEAVTATRSRLAIGALLTNCFRSLIELSPDDVAPALFLITGRVAPEHEGVELSVGGAAVSAALAEATGATRARIGELYRSCGDLGDVAAALKGRQRPLRPPPPLSVRGVLASLRRLAAEGGTGTGVAQRRRGHCLALLRAARGPETRFLVRTLLGNMRVGASRISVLAALAAAAAHARAAAAGAPPPDKAALEAAAAAVARAHSLCPSFDVLVPALLSNGPEGLAQACPLVPGVPISPMLAKVAAGVPDALTLLRNHGGSGAKKGDAGAIPPFLAEWKYDGQRAQLHLLPRGGGVRIFSRSGEDCSGAFPDVAAALLAAAAGGPAAAGGCVLDGELVAVDRANGNRVRPFQELSTRARGADVALTDVSVAVCAFVFDCLSLDGHTLVDEPLSRRRAAVRAALPSLAATRGRIETAEGEELCADATDADADHVADADADHADADADAGATALEARLRLLLQRSLAGGCEGLMLKRLGAAYEPDRRASAWLKLKKDYCAELQDSLDLVPIGAWRGSGRKHAWYSPFLLACYDPETERWSSVCRVMSGFTDAFYKERFAYYHQGAGLQEGDPRRELPHKPPYYDTLDVPDVWLAPTEVWEIRGADLTLSPRHTAAAGRVHASRGVSLRFPRFIRVREDRKPETASGPDAVADLYRAQHRCGGGAAGGAQAGGAAAALEALPERDEEEEEEEE